jgi:hypothetical protein
MGEKLLYRQFSGGEGQLWGKTTIEHPPEVLQFILLIANGQH